jgi:hypothetical protein
MREKAGIQNYKNQSFFLTPFSARGLLGNFWEFHNRGAYIDKGYNI